MSDEKPVRMTAQEHRDAAEVLAAEAFKFQKSLIKATESKQDGSERSRVPLSVINYLTFLQSQALIHATIALVPEPIVEEVDFPLQAIGDPPPVHFDSPRPPQGVSKPSRGLPEELICPICGWRRTVWSLDTSQFNCNGDGMLIGHPIQPMVRADERP